MKSIKKMDYTNNINQHFILQKNEITKNKIKGENVLSNKIFMMNSKINVYGWL